MSLKEMLGLWPVSPFSLVPWLSRREKPSPPQVPAMILYAYRTRNNSPGTMHCNLNGEPQEIWQQKAGRQSYKTMPSIKPREIVTWIKEWTKFCVTSYSQRGSPCDASWCGGGTIRKVSKSVVTRYTKEESPLPLKQSLRDSTISSAF